MISENAGRFALGFMMKNIKQSFTTTYKTQYGKKQILPFNNLHTIFGVFIDMLINPPTVL